LDPKNIYSKGLRDKSAAFSGTDKDFWKTIWYSKSYRLYHLIEWIHLKCKII
jgi:hypothetical protein